MYYVLWFILTISGCLLAALTGLWIERKLSEKGE